VGPGRSDLQNMLKLCVGLRDHIRALIEVNVSSWEIGRAATDR
jgi:hypothetical protein